MIINIGEKHDFFMGENEGSNTPVNTIEGPATYPSNGNLSPTMIKMLNEQLAYEAYTARLDLRIGTYLKNMGLDGLAKYFYVEFAEENEHQVKVSDYLTERAELVLCLTVPNVTFVPTTLTAIADFYLAQMRLTTKRYKDIAAQAFSESDFLTFKFAQDMLIDQLKGENDALSFRDKMYLANNNTSTLLLLDAEYAEE